MVVIKVGGGLLASAGALEAVLAEVAEAGRRLPLLVVPGGGLFADVVRELHRHGGLSEDAAHWMAILAMDQYAHLLVCRLADGVLVSSIAEIEDALRAGRIPVLAPYQWLRQTDPLPHSWDVTSDSIAAWVAEQVGACRLVLVKPPGVRASDEVTPVVDASFAQVISTDTEVVIVPADQARAVRAACGGPGA
jgi:aspartokinase-like uncharacterized kinase